VSVPAKDWSHLTDAELAATLFEYREGALYWRVQKANNIKAGDRAGRLKANGYREIRFRDRQVGEHRVIWLLLKGVWPTGEIDHINAAPADNRIENLRDVPGWANMQNRQRSRGSSRFVGVGRHKQSGKWQATIGVGGRIIYLGLYDTEEVARDAYLAAKSELHPMAPSAGE